MLNTGGATNVINGLENIKLKPEVQSFMEYFTISIYTYKVGYITAWVHHCRTVFVKLCINKR